MQVRVRRAVEAGLADTCIFTSELPQARHRYFAWESTLSDEALTRLNAVLPASAKKLIRIVVASPNWKCRRTLQALAKLLDRLLEIQ